MKTKTSKATKQAKEKKVAAPAAKSAKKAGTAKAKAKLSAIDAAAQVLADEGRPMNTREMIEVMTGKGLWTSPNGKTPHATLYAAILRELKVKKGEARFQKVERGKFAANGRK